MLKLIGQGAFGDVWIARNVTGALRAVKVVRRDRFSSSEPYDREFRGLQRFAGISMESARQLALLHVGRNHVEGFFYSVMELADDAVSGREIHPDTYVPLTLRELRKRRTFVPAAEVIRIGMDLAGALADLHQRGLIHRDIKPSNVIVVGGVPKLADIGLIAREDEARTVHIGTEGYIPPEGPGTPKADIYALGKVLYELSTGLDRKLHPDFPLDLESRRDQRLFFELNDVIDRACANKIDERYRSAREMVGDLTLLQAGKSVLWLRSVQRWSRRVARLAAVLACLSAALGWLYFREILSERQQREHLADNFRLQAISLANAGDKTGSLPLLLRAMELRDNSSEKFLADISQLVISLQETPNLDVLQKYDKHINDTRFSPDSKRLAVALETGEVDFWDPAGRRSLGRRYPSMLPGIHGVTNQGIQSVGYSKDGKYVVCAGDLGAVFVWEVQAPESTAKVFQHGECVYSAVMSPDNRHLATACGDKVIRMWNVATGKIEWQLDVHANCFRLAYAPDGSRLAAALEDAARLYSLKDESPKLEFEARHDRYVYDVSFSPDGEMFATACGDQDVRLWKTAGATLERILSHSAMVTSSRFSNDGRHLITAAREGLVKSWSTHLFLGAPTIFPHPENANAADCSPDNHWIAAGGASGILRVWNQEVMAAYSASELPTPARHKPSWFPVPGMAKTGTNSLASIENDLRKHVAITEILACYPTASGGRLLCQIDDHTVMLWDAAQAVEVSRHGVGGNKYLGVKIHPDGQWVTLESMRQVSLLNLATGEFRTNLLVTPSVHEDYFMTTSAFSPDGNYLCVAGSTVGDSSCPCLIYQLDPSRRGLDLLPTHMGHRDGVRKVVFCPDGATLVSVGEDREAVAWSTRTWQPRFPAMQHAGEARLAAISPDSSRLLTVSVTRPPFVDTLCLWDLSSGMALTSRVRTGVNISEVSYLPERRCWAWMEASLPGQGTPKAHFFLPYLDPQKAAALRDKAASQMGFQINTTGDRVPLPLEFQQFLHDRHAEPVPIELSAPGPTDQ